MSKHAGRERGGKMGGKVAVPEPDPISLQQQQLRWRCAAFCPPQITSLSWFHHKRAGISLSFSLSCTCFVSVCFFFARQSACRKLPTCQVASCGSQLDAASFIHSLTVSAFPLSVRSSLSPSVSLSICPSALAWLASFCVFLSEKLSGCR